MTKTQASQLVSTSQFEFSHGKRPSGFGYWGFELTYSKSTGRKPTQFWATAKFGEAKARALAEVQLWEFGAITLVSVLP